MTGIEMNENEIRELIGAYALNAIDDPAEVTAVEALVARDPAAAAELARHEEVCAALAAGIDGVAPPPSVWEGMQSRITPRVAAVAAVPAAPEATVATVTDIASRRRRARMAIGIAVAAAAVTIGLVAWPDSGAPNDQFATAITAPGAKAGELTGGDPTGRAISARVVIRPDGSGLVDGNALPDAGEGSVYQLWALDSGTPVSVGVIGERPGTAEFTAPPGTTTLALSIERAPSAERPTLPPVASGTLS